MTRPPSRISYDVIIVGGAAVGSATAYFLATDPAFRGSVLVIERDWTYARSATALSSSSIRHQFSNRINIEMAQFGTEFIRSFRERAAVKCAAPETAFHEKGYLFLASPSGKPILERNYATQRALGAEVVLLPPE